MAKEDLILFCRTLLFIITAMPWSTTLLVAAMPQDDDAKRTAGVRAALGAIFADDHVAQEALLIHERALRLDETERFEFLSQWVLPSDDHNSLRMQCEFTPTCPAPMFQGSQGRSSPVADLPGNFGSNPAFTGGNLVSPAMDLVTVAASLNRLAEIQTVVDQWQVKSPEDQKSRIVFQLLIAIAQQDSVSAELRMREILAMAGSWPGPAWERHTEAIAVWAGSDITATRELARELAVLLHQDAWSGPLPRSERWKRQITSRRYLLDVAIASGKKVHEAITEQQSLKNWLPVSRMTSETRGAGYPIPVWNAAQGQANHVAGHDHDYLYFASPLTGIFSVEADLSTFEYRDIHLGLGSYWAGSSSERNGCVNASFRYDGPLIPIAPPLTRMFETMRVRMVVKDGKRTTYVNGRDIYQRPQGERSDPWLSIHSWWLTNGSVKNLRVLGDPVIPNEVKLITPDLAGWVAYFDESVGGQGADWFATDSRELGETALRQKELGKSTELVSPRRPDRVGTFSQSLIRYHRPMAEDGTIEYEFFYQPGQSLVHPTLDRLSLMLNPTSVDVHWITDGRHDPTSLRPDNVTAEPQNQKHKGLLPFKPDEWNSLALTVRDNTVDVTLNGTLVFSRELEPNNLRTFGLFHYADQTEARVRNIRWRGDWPKELPAPLKQELASDEVEKLIGDPNALPLVFEHDFSKGVPSGLFSVAGEKWEENLKQVQNGAQLRRPGGEYVNYSIVSPVLLTGDFDITASFEDFATQTELDYGEGNIQLAVTLDDDRSRECFLFRKVFGVPPDTREQLIQAAIFEKRGGETQYLFFDNPPEESNTGRMRLIRRGIKLSYLYAEDDSTEFRLIHTEPVSDADGTVKLIVGQHKSGFSQTVWKKLSVQAQSSFGGPEQSLKSVALLDEERSSLPAERVYDFARPTPVAGTAGLGPFDVWSHTNATYSQDKDGLTITVPGSENWQAAGLVPRLALDGDFDISLELDVAHMEPCKMGDESVVLLQAEFNDKRKSNSEVKFSIHHGGDRKAETQQRRIRGDGTFNYQEIVSRPETTASLLRLARRGDVIYQIFQGEPDSPPQILGAMKMGTDPVPLGLLRALIHTGGDNRKTVIRFKSFRIQAEKIVDG